MKTCLKLAGRCIAASLALASLFSCSKELAEDLAPAPPAKGTVTLRLSAPGTRTSLLNDKTVLWSEGDKVVINDVTYDVTISADDPGVATVENVTEADEYFAIYVYSWTDNDSPQYAKVKDGDSFYYLLELPDWQVCQKGTFASFVNPMAGYGKGTDMKFHNLGSVVKIGLTGNGETISDVTLVSNSGNPLAGVIKVTEAQFASGSYSEAVVDTGYTSYDAVGISCDGSSVVLSSEPVWFYFVCIPFTDEGGISIAATDTEGNVFTYSKTDTFSADRSGIVEMPALEFSAFEPVELSVNDETSAVSVAVDAAGKTGMPLRGTAVSSAVWENYAGGYADEQARAEALLNASSASVQYFLSGETVKFDKVRNYVGNYVAIAPQTGYKVIAQYSLGSNGVGKCAILDVTTPAATGTAPALDLKIDSFTFNEIHATITASDAADISVWLFDKETYESLGKTDSEIMKDYGKPLNEEQTAQANSEGCQWNWWDLSQLTDYVILATAASDTGAETIVRKDVTTAFYIFNPETTVLETVTTQGKVVTNLFYPFSGISSALAEMTFSGLTVKKVPGMDVFVIDNLFKGNAELKNAGFADKNGDFPTIIDARDASAVDILFEMNDTGVYNTRYYGFSSPCRFGCYATYNTSVSRDDYPLGIYDKTSGKIEFANSLVMGNEKLYGPRSFTLEMPVSQSQTEDGQAFSIENFSKSQGNW